MAKIRIEYLNNAQVMSCVDCGHCCGAVAPSHCPACHELFNSAIAVFQDGSERELPPIERRNAA